MRERGCGRIRIFHNGRPSMVHARLKFESTKLLQVPPELYSRATNLHPGRVEVVSGIVANDTVVRARELRVELKCGAVNERRDPNMAVVSLRTGYVRPQSRDRTHPQVLEPRQAVENATSARLTAA